jgi:hypothetical protein
MESLFRDFPFIFLYLDNMLIFSRSRSDHLGHLDTVLAVLAENGLHINPAKCQFAQPEVDFLGHHVTASGLSPIASHTQPILEFPTPSDVKMLQKFLGMLNFWRRFLPGIARVLKPLTDATSGKGKLLWTSEMQIAFDHAKALLVSAVPLQHPHPHATLSLATDASDTHVGAVLQQKTDGCWLPLAFLSHKLSPTESRYSTFDHELLSAFQAVKHFRFFLEGRPFTLFTDHKPLVAAISKSKTPFSSRQQRHLSFLSKFTTNFVHLPGKENIVADVLSRPPTLPPSYDTPPPPLPINTTAPITLFPMPLSYLEIAKAQSTCPSIPSLLKNSSLNITSIPFLLNFPC